MRRAVAIVLVVCIILSLLHESESWRRRRRSKKLVEQTGPSGLLNKAIAEGAVGREQENKLTNQQWNMEVLEADQNEKGKRLEQEVNAEQLQENKLDLISSFQHDESAEKENELGLKEDDLEPTE